MVGRLLATPTFRDKGIEAPAWWRGDPDFAPLAREVRIAAEAVLTLARQEEARAEETTGSTGRAGLPTINESTPRPDLAGILDEWRAVERRLGAADPASSEAQGLMEQFETLRDRYAQALEALHRKEYPTDRRAS